jgi:hypothetical protein
MIRYEYEDMLFEFERDGAPTVGTVKVTVGETTYVGKVDLIAPNSRSTYTRQARALYPEAFTDDLTLPRALNELGVHVDDEERIRKAKEDEAVVDENDVTDVDDEKAEELVSTPGVLNRYVEAMARVNEVHGDRDVMRVITLSALSAQLALPAENKPVGTSALLVGESSRGKNFVVDAVASGMPESMVYQFESASSKSFYYESAAKPQRFEHTWLYANEIEAVDELIEVLRPLLSQGVAVHKTVDKVHDSNTFREFKIKGPITACVPTTRNTTDRQFMTRLLVVELEDFEGRIAEHSRRVAKVLLPDYAAQDHTEELNLWKKAFEKLTSVRRVVIPNAHPEFCITSEDVSHGARVWRSFLSLVLANAWLEQRNREVRALREDLDVVVAQAEDYRVAYEIFQTTAGRSVVNISATHRKILDALYALEGDEGKTIARDNGFSLRKIAEKAGTGVSHETVRKNKAFLCSSLGFVVEMERGGLRLVGGADPEWWAHPENILEGFPRPEKVSLWWGSGNGVDSVDTGPQPDEPPIDKPKNLSTEKGGHQVDTSTPTPEQVDMSTRLSTPHEQGENGVGMPNPAENDPMSTVSTRSGDSEERRKVDYHYITEEGDEPDPT